MSADTIYNAAPEVINLGTQDLSTQQLPIEPEQVPQHCPKFYLYTQQGPTSSQLVSSAHAGQLYGTASFDVRQNLPITQLCSITTLPLWAINV